IPGTSEAGGAQAVLTSSTLVVHSLGNVSKFFSFMGRRCFLKDESESRSDRKGSSLGVRHQKLVSYLNSAPQRETSLAAWGWAAVTSPTCGAAAIRTAVLHRSDVHRRGRVRPRSAATPPGPRALVRSGLVLCQGGTPPCAHRAAPGPPKAPLPDRC